MTKAKDTPVAADPAAPDAHLLAEASYAAYAKQAGGVTFDGKPLPTFEELGEERQSCWVAASSAAYYFGG